MKKVCTFAPAYKTVVVHSSGHASVVQPLTDNGFVSVEGADFWKLLNHISDYLDALKPSLQRVHCFVSKRRRVVAFSYTRKLIKQLKFMTTEFVKANAEALAEALTDLDVFFNEFHTYEAIVEDTMDGMTKINDLILLALQHENCTASIPVDPVRFTFPYYITNLVKALRGIGRFIDRHEESYNEFARLENEGLIKCYCPNFDR